MNDDFAKELQAVFKKYGRKALKDCENMSIEEEKKYIDKWQPIMQKEVDEVIKKYENKGKDEKK